MNDEESGDIDDSLVPFGLGTGPSSWDYFVRGKGFAELGGQIWSSRFRVSLATPDSDWHLGIAN